MNTSKSFTIPRQLQPYLLTTLIACATACCGCQSIALNDAGIGGPTPHATHQPNQSLNGLVQHKLKNPIDYALRQTSTKPKRPIYGVPQQPISDKIAAGFSKLIELPKDALEKVQQPQPRKQVPRQASRISKRQVKPEVALVNYETSEHSEISMPSASRRNGQQLSQVQPPASSRIAAGFSKLFGSKGNSQEKPQQSPVARPHHANQVHVARQMEQQGNLNEALRIYESEIRGGNSSPVVLQRLAVLYDTTGQPELATPLYQRALAMVPHNAELQCDYGFHLFLQGSLFEAEQHYRQALIASPKHARTHNNLGVLFAHLNRREDALQQFMFAGLDRDQAQHNLSFAISQTQNIQVASNTGPQSVHLNFSD